MFCMQSLYKIKIIVRSFGSSKKFKEDGPYCTISGNAPSSVTLYKTESRNEMNIALINGYILFRHSNSNSNSTRESMVGV